MDSPAEKNDLPPGKPFKRAALFVSLLFHVALVVGLAYWYVSRRSDSQTAPVARAAESEPAAVPTRPNPPRSSPDVTSAQVNNTLDRMQEVYEEKLEDEQLSVLEEKASELENLASEESIDEIAAKFQEWTNIQPRATAPAEESIDGEFEFDTAQLHEVRKIDGEDGSVRYHGVLVDAHGRTFDVEMSPAEGETAYRTLATLKRFPLADRVYRQIAMPLIDQAAASTKMAAKAETTSGQDEEDDRDPFDGQLDDTPAKAEESEIGAGISPVDDP